MLSQQFCLVLLALCTTAWAQIQFSKPASGAAATLSGGKLDIEWVASSTSNLAGFQILLMAGGSSDDLAGQVAAVGGTTLLSAGATSATMSVPAGAGPPSTNAYYLKMSVTRTDGGSALFYSDRFSISGMTGGFPASSSGQGGPAVQAAYNQVKSDITAVPASQNQAVVPNQAVAPSAVGGDAPAYSLQTTGDIKTAPMQQQPPTSITAQNIAPLYPTTAFNIAQQPFGIGSFISTQTIARTWSTSSIENTASAAQTPANDMAKFLARWKD